MRRCKVCGCLLVSENEGTDHIGFEPYGLNHPVFVCQSCLYAIQNQFEESVSYKYADI